MTKHRNKIFIKHKLFGLPWHCRLIMYFYYLLNNFRGKKVKYILHVLYTQYSIRSTHNVIFSYTFRKQYFATTLLQWKASPAGNRLAIGWLCPKINTFQDIIIYYVPKKCLKLIFVWPQLTIWLTSMTSWPCAR